MPTIAAPATSRVRIDEHGRAWVEGANVKVIEVAISYLADRMTAEEMSLEYPHLSPGQIHAALAYYYDHQAEFDREVEQSLRNARRLRAADANSPLRQKLQAAGLIG